jgi:hypothetical protein
MATSSEQAMEPDVRIVGAEMQECADKGFEGFVLS